MWKFGVLSFLISISISHARPGDEDLRVIIIDDTIQKSDFPRHVKFDKKRSRMSFTRDQRDTQFEKLKLTPHLEQMNADELDRDLLYMALKNKNKSLPELVAENPRIPAGALAYAKNNFSP